VCAEDHANGNLARGALHLRIAVTRGTLRVIAKSGGHDTNISNFPAALLRYAFNANLKVYQIQFGYLMFTKGAS